MKNNLERRYKRQFDELRSIKIEKGIAPNADGSLLISFGNTKIICTAILERKVPKWMSQQNVEGGWISAEYSLLPYSTLERKQRDSSRGKVDGRTVEIQRIIGRAMRAVVDLKKLPGYTLWLDCDVLQADGGTRTVAITGAYVAAQLAIRKFINLNKLLPVSPFKDSVAAVSVGLLNGKPILDLDYLEDRDADADVNVVMTGKGQFVEIQGTGEEATFSEEELKNLIDLAKKGIIKITNFQREALLSTLKS